MDRDMWEKIVLNLLSNALKFTFEGGVTIAVRNGGGAAELIVSDTGIGIPAAELPHIFERFHRVAGARGRTIEGSGIGLALVQELVKMHEGTIDVQSEPGCGTTFSVRIPFGARHAAEATGAHPAAPTTIRPDIFVQEAERWVEDGEPVSAPVDAPEKPEKVLLADDNPDMRQYVARLLGHRYIVTTAANGDDALASALADPPDLILSDVMMPGLDGFALLRELRARPETRTIPIVLVSARAGEESRVEGLSSGADDYLIKPFTARELLARVGAHLAMRRRRRQAEAALAHSQATLQSFYDSSPLLMGVVAMDSDVVEPVYFNRATAQFPDPPPLDPIWREKFRHSRESGRPVHFEYEHVLRFGPFLVQRHGQFSRR
jgi:CheY-like chemotaxis protein/anti-sigma regulatory factor (Ser/Thr protein kinase)